MDKTTLLYLVFALVMLVGLVLDLGVFSKKNQEVSTKQALVQTLFWVCIALGFFFFMWFEEGHQLALEYISAYLMEWSLSVDNIFVFIILFASFQVRKEFFGRVLLIGILMAIAFRIIFITIGVELVERFHFLLYIFGVFLLYTGVKIFRSTEDQEFEPHDSKIYHFLKRFLPLTPSDGNGKLIIRENGRPAYTTLFVVVVMLGAIDLVFALDSIPAVMGISTHKLVIYTSNIFAVLGLRSLFFLLRHAVAKFDYLQQGIGIVLVFIGLKMLAEHWLDQWLSNTAQVIISLLIILTCIGGSMVYSLYHQKKGTPESI
jgi:tellurite resistance protein TerC